MNCGDKRRYDDIIDLPHHVSKKRPRMDPLARAAQFSPFAALTGFESYIAGEGRYSESRPILDEEEKALIDARLRKAAGTGGGPLAGTLFVGGGAETRGVFMTVTGTIKLIDTVNGLIGMENGKTVPIDDIYDVSDGPEPSALDGG